MNSLEANGISDSKRLQGRSLIGFSVLGGIVVSDQLLIPMLHIGGIPYKISYFIVAFWFLSYLIIPSKTITSSLDRRDFMIFSSAIAIICFCGILGDFFVTIFTHIESYSQSYFSYTIYLFAIFSFGFGFSAKKFNYKWLIYMLLFSAIVNLLFIFFKSNLPGWLVNFYFPPRAIENLASLGIDSVEDILELARPRGMFNNPNGSALMLNIIALFICVAMRKGLLVVKNRVIGILIIVLPLFVCILLASRGEILVALILGYLNYKAIFTSVGFTKKVMYFAISIVVIMGVFSLVLNRIDSDGNFLNSINRAYSIFEVLNNSSNAALDGYEQRNQGVSRPLLMFETAYDRFLYSPLFGTGFNIGPNYPFDHGTQFFHNDWFRLLITGGIISFLVLIYIIRKFCIPISFILLLPFILPGLVNTFLLNIPVVMFYFFMVANMRSHLREQTLTIEEKR